MFAVEFERVGEDEAFGEGGAVEAEHEIGNEFHLRGAAGDAGVYGARGKCSKKFFAVLERGRESANHDEDFRAADLIAVARDGGIKVGGAGGSE